MQDSFLIFRSTNISTPEQCTRDIFLSFLVLKPVQLISSASLRFSRRCSTSWTQIVKFFMNITSKLELTLYKTCFRNFALQLELTDRPIIKEFEIFKYKIKKAEYNDFFYFDNDSKILFSNLLHIKCIKISNSEVHRHTNFTESRSCH